MSKSKEQFREDVAVKERTRTSEPKLYKVILLNDDYTTMDFVVQVLRFIFHLSIVEAEKVMLSVHHHGSGVAGVYPKEVAETKVLAVHQFARQNEYPLKCLMQPE